MYVLLLLVFLLLCCLFLIPVAVVGKFVRPFHQRFPTFLRSVGTVSIWVVASILLFLLLSFTRYRIPTGPPIEYTTQVRYQMLDLGQDEPDSLRILIEGFALNSRLFLREGPLPFIYLSNQQRKECWPESPHDMLSHGYTVQISFRVRKLQFATGWSRAEVIRIQMVPGSPQITK
jgi:hypothetical protein